MEAITNGPYGNRIQIKLEEILGKTSTGFLVDVLHVCQLTVSRAMISAIMPEAKKIHQLISVR